MKTFAICTLGYDYENYNYIETIEATIVTGCYYTAVAWFEQFLKNSETAKTVAENFKNATHNSNFVMIDITNGYNPRHKSAKIFAEISIVEGVLFPRVFEDIK